MKFHSAYLLMLLFAVVTASCSKDNKDKKANNRLEGQWNGTKMELQIKQGPITFDSTYQITPPDYYKLNFKSQNQVDIDIHFQGQQGQGTGYYVTQGNQLTLATDENAADSEKTVFTYMVSGDDLTLTTSAKDTVNNEVVTGHEILYLKRQ